MEHLSPNGGSVGEDSDAEHDDDGSRQLRTHTDLITHPDDKGGDGDVGEEGDDEDAVGEIRRPQLGRGARRGLKPAIWGQVYFGRFYLLFC